MMRGVSSLAEQTQRQRRGGFVTRARLGGQAMTAPARAGFRARFERQALEHAASQQRTLTPQQLDEATTALLQAHMALMTEKRLAKRYQAVDGRHGAPTEGLHGLRRDADEIELLMAQAQRKALGDSSRDRAAIQRIAEPVRLCIGCWVEMCAGQPFPREATSMLCAEHQAAYLQSVTPAKHDDRPATKAKTKTRKASVRQHERSRDLNQQSRHRSL